MNKMIKIRLTVFSIFLISLFMSSCKNDYFNSIDLESNSLDFVFRANEKLVGTELNVVATKNGVEFSNEKRQITASDRSFSFNYKDIEVGSNLGIVATIKKNNVELYKGEKSTIVTAGENKLSIDLNPLTVDFIINIPENGASIDGAVLKVNVDGVEKNKKILNAGDYKVSVGLEGLTLDNNVSFVVENDIKDDTFGKVLATEVLYESENPYKVIPGSSTVNANLVENKGYFLWQYDSDGAPAKYIFDIVKVKNLANYSLKNVTTYSNKHFSLLADENSLFDYCINDNNELWVLSKKGTSTPQISWVDLKNPSKDTVITSHISEGGSKLVRGLRAVCPFGNGLLSGRSTGGSGGGYVFAKVVKEDVPTSGETLNFKSTPIPITDFPSSEKPRDLWALTVNGNDIYIGASDGGYGKEDIVLQKFQLNQDNSSIKYIKTAELIDYRDYIITDLAFIDGYLYATMLNKSVSIDGSGNSVSSGGILKLDSELKIVKTLGFAPEGKEYYTSDDEVKNCFVGPRRIVAVKPKKLIIADDGKLKFSADDGKAKKRLVEVDLESFAISNISDDLNGENVGGMFDGNIKPSSSGFSYVHNCPVGRRG